MMIRRPLLFVAALALGLLPTLAHAEVVTTAIDAPRFASVDALLSLPAPAAPVAAPARVLETDEARPEAPVEEPDQATPAQLWASAMRAFGHR